MQASHISTHEKLQFPILPLTSTTITTENQEKTNDRQKIDSALPMLITETFFVHIIYTALRMSSYATMFVLNLFLYLLITIN